MISIAVDKYCEDSYSYYNAANFFNDYLSYHVNPVADAYADAEEKIVDFATWLKAAKNVYEVWDFPQFKSFEELNSLYFRDFGVSNPDCIASRSNIAFDKDIIDALVGNQMIAYVTPKRGAYEAPWVRLPRLKEASLQNARPFVGVVCTVPDPTMENEILLAMYKGEVYETLNKAMRAYLIDRGAIKNECTEEV